MSEIKENDLIKVHYTGKLENGEVFDSSADREPLEFKVGEGKLIPGFEGGVIGMKEGDKKEVFIKYEEAYGAVIDELLFEVEKSKLPQDMAPEVGMQLISRGQDGSENPVYIKEVKESSVVIDANHPLAGKNLVFEIEIVAVN